uniref:Uncharacterized protein n=1 Tax=Anguilla anguilla TaxID=7936 RepID=A0A0E9QAY0_ANGAN
MSKLKKTHLHAGVPHSNMQH